MEVKLVFAKKGKFICDLSNISLLYLSLKMFISLHFEFLQKNISRKIAYSGII